jgi:Fibronectin type III domain
MASQTFGAIWVWIANKMPTYKAPVVEITVNTNLDTTVHNGRLLICSQPVTLTPLVSNMGSGFQCTVINASTGNLTLSSGFVSSNGSLALAPWESATLSCATYSAGTIAFAAMPATSTAAISVPGQVDGVSSSGITSSTITVSWQAPSSGGVVSSYIVQYRLTGTTTWSSGASVVGVTTYQLTGLQAGTSYDIAVQAQNPGGLGAAASVLTVLTSSSTQAAPPQVSGLAASPTSSSAIQLSWSAQTGSAPATSYTVQYRVTGSPKWTSSMMGISGAGTAITGLQAATSYDFVVNGVSSAGAGPMSSTVTATTLAASQSVISITWNLLPSGAYAHASGAIGINAHISPAASPVQFGFSLSATTPPSSWTAANLVNTDLWGAYVPTPATAGDWYIWGEGLDGSAPTVSPSPFVVQ